MCSTARMELVESADGTRIALHRTGTGTPVVIVGGAFSTSAAGEPLAGALAELGLEGVTYDRRGRAESGDTAPYAPYREAEDLTAVIEHVGGRAAVLGHSSGAVLALFAAGEGAPISHLFLSEPPFRFGVDPAPEDLPVRLQALIDAGEPAEAVVTFQREGVGLPDAVIEQIRSSPIFDGLLPLAQSTVYDATITAEVETPTEAMTGVGMPVVVLRGEPTFPILVAAAERLAASMATAELVVVPESHDHGLDPEATARLVRSRIS
jgi:pimeloyl-ACP methyl ester carboxylesterase